MGYKDESIKPRLLWLGRLAAKSTVLLGVFIGIAVYAARIPGQYVCLQVINGFGNNGRQFDLVDLQSGNDMLDNRAGQAAFGFPSPDGNYAAALQPDKSGTTSSLIIKSADNARVQMRPVVAQDGMVNSTTGFYRLGNMQWANDSSRLAYLWMDSDQQMYLSIVRADGSSRVTVPYADMASGTNTPNLQINWSADNRYLSVGETSGNAGIRYTLWSAGDLQRADTDRQISFRAGAWSPQAHQFAAIQEDQAGSQAFTLWSSPTEEVRVAMNSAPGKLLDQIMWSPDGQYIALQSHRPCDALESCSERLSYDILGNRGQPITSNMDGEAELTASNSTTQFPYRTFYYYNSSMPVVTWTADSASLVFLQQSPAENVADLVAYRVSSGQAETIARNIVGDMAQEMLSTSLNAFFRRRGFGRPAATLSGTRLVLPTYSDNNKINVDLADLDGGNRVTLVQDADEILDARPTQGANGSRFWLSNGQMVVVAWVTINPVTKAREAHLTWANADGSNKHQIDDNLEAINQVQVIQGKTQQRWLGYIAQKQGLYGIELADILTGAIYHVLDGFTTIEQWTLTPAPVGSQAAVQLGISGGRTFSENTLYVVNLDSGQARQITTQAAGLAYWSPDGSKLAFLSHDSSSSSAASYAQVVRADGTELQNVPMSNSSSSYPRLFRWSQCS